MPPPGLWLTPGMTDRLIELHGRRGSASLSMAEIAAKISAEFGKVTRNAVIGKCRRLGLGEHPEKPKPAKPEPVVRRRYVRPRPAAIVYAPQPASIDGDHPLTLLQLRDGDCRWPLGPIERKSIFFCGKACETDRSWCPEHWARGRIKARVAWA